MKTKISFSLSLSLSLLFFCAPNVFSQCTGIRCGDCNLDGNITVLDALETARISVGLLAPYPDQNIACDTDRSGDISVIDALTVAKAAVGDKTVSLRCFPFTIIDNIGPGVILHRELIGMDYDVLNPDFSCPDTTNFFEIIPDRGTTQLTITLAGMSYPTNMNLYTGKPGTMPGDIDSHHYLQRIRMDSTPETYQLSCSGLLDTRMGRVAVAVHSASPGFYSLDVSGSDVPCTCNPSGGIIAAGARAFGRIRGQRGPDIPNPCDTTNSQTYELTTIPPGTTSIRFLMTGPPPRDDGDYDLWLGYPRTCGGDCYATNYHGTALATPEGWGNPMFIEEYEMTGPELASYGSGPIAMGVSVFTGPPGGGNFTLDVFTRGSGGPAMASQQGTSPVSGSVSTCRLDSWILPGEDRWRFGVQAGATVDVSVDTASDGGAFDPILAIYEEGETLPILAVDNVRPCSFAPPRLAGVTTGSECPVLSVGPGVTPKTYVVSVKRSPNGFCRDAANGSYDLTVEVNGQPLSLTPVRDDY